MEMIDVLVPTTDGRELLLMHYTRPESRLLLDARTVGPAAVENYRLGGWVSIPDVVKTFRSHSRQIYHLGSLRASSQRSWTSD